MQTSLRRDANLESDIQEEDGGLPAYREADWVGRSPAEHPPTIPTRFAAEFVLWVARSGQLTSSEYDFYRTEEFHRARSEGLIRHAPLGAESAPSRARAPQP